MRALVTGACGQDGTLLRALLVRRGYDVLGIDRVDMPRQEGGSPVRSLDAADAAHVRALIKEFEPDQIYHLTACHHSSERLGDIRLDREMVATNFLAVENLVGAISELRPSCRILIAGSSQMYSVPAGSRLLVDEDTAMRPSSFYGHTKAWSRELLAHYRNSRGVYGTTVILFNHESTLRGPGFVTRKVTQAAARSKAGHDARLHLRDIRSETDWSSASDIVEGMRLALEAAEPDDYVLGSGTTHRVEELLQYAFGSLGLDWAGFTTFDAAVEPPPGVLVANPARARARLGWEPRVDFRSLVAEMVSHDVALLAANSGQS